MPSKSKEKIHNDAMQGLFAKNSDQELEASRRMVLRSLMMARYIVLSYTHKNPLDRDSNDNGGPEDTSNSLKNTVLGNVFDLFASPEYQKSLKSSDGVKSLLPDDYTKTLKGGSTSNQYNRMKRYFINTFSDTIAPSKDVYDDFLRLPLSAVTSSLHEMLSNGKGNKDNFQEAFTRAKKCLGCCPPDMEDKAVKKLYRGLPETSSVKSKDGKELSREEVSKELLKISGEVTEDDLRYSHIKMRINSGATKPAVGYAVGIAAAGMSLAAYSMDSPINAMLTLASGGALAYDLSKPIEREIDDYSEYMLRKKEFVQSDLDFFNITRKKLKEPVEPSRQWTERETYTPQKATSSLVENDDAKLDERSSDEEDVLTTEIFPSVNESIARSKKRRRQQSSTQEVEESTPVPTKQRPLTNFDQESFNAVLLSISNDDSRELFSSKLNEEPVVSKSGNNLKILKNIGGRNGDGIKNNVFELRHVGRSGSEARMFFLRHANTFHALSATNRHEVNTNTLRTQASNKLQELGVIQENTRGV